MLRSPVWRRSLPAVLTLGAVPLALHGPMPGQSSSPHAADLTSSVSARAGLGGQGWSPFHRLVFTRISVYQEDVSYGALGGEFKNITVTLLPSDPHARYGRGTVTLGCATVSHGFVMFTQNPSYNQPIVLSVGATAPGNLTLPTITHFTISHSSPTCGANPMGGPYTLYVRYSGGVSGGHVFAPDTYCAVPVVPEGFDATSTNTQDRTNLFGCPNTGPATTVPQPAGSSPGT